MDCRFCTTAPPREICCVSCRGGDSGGWREAKMLGWMCPEMVALRLIHLNVGSSDSKALGCKVIDRTFTLESRLLRYYSHVCLLKQHLGSLRLPGLNLNYTFVTV